MGARQQLDDFLRSTFRSVWSLEVLLAMMQEPGRHWSREALVETLRASGVIVERAIGELSAAGLILPESDDAFRYAPATPELEALAEAARSQYRNAPDAVRRIIIAGRDGGLSAFAEAFRLRKE